jgi:hypothetical protein
VSSDEDEKWFKATTIIYLRREYSRLRQTGGGIILIKAIEIVLRHLSKH